MKKITNILLLVFLSVVMISGTAYAISGQCSNCHTMHASQNGTLWGDGPHDYLLLYSCLGCHSANNNESVRSDTNAPRVLSTNAAPGGQGNGNTLAGGDFYWVANGSDALGHNVDLVAGQDAAIGANIGNQPPGWDDTLTDGAGNSIADATWTVQLTCAGTYGCHGDHSNSGNDAGIQGAHHSNPGTDSLITAPTAVGNSYRFCDRIEGKEDATWNWGETTALHNEYFGSTYNDGSALDKGTISFFCAECHGDYHTTADVGGTSSPWLRHPTDIVLGRGAGTEYSDYNNGGTTYNLEAPVARPVVDGSSPTATVDPNDNSTSDGAIVMCLSCHRAHGSPQPDILRWDYTTIIAGGGSLNSGCFVCHTTKDTP